MEMVGAKTETGAALLIRAISAATVGASGSARETVGDSPAGVCRARRTREEQ